MKKFAFFYFALYMFPIIKAQVVFCPPKTVWTNVFTHSWPNQTLEYENVVYTGNQIQGADTVKILSHSRFFLQTNGFNTGPTYIKQKGDTVFMKNVRTNNNWQILYNYAAQPGDSWTNTINISVPTSTKIVQYTTMVTSRQYMNVGGTNLIQLSVQQTHSGYSPPYSINYNITERFGSSVFLFPFAGRFASVGDEFIENLCYFDSIFGSYRLTYKTCDYLNTVGLAEIEPVSSLLATYPNPANNMLTIKLEQQDAFVSNYKCTLYILNSLGEKIKQEEINLENKTADIQIDDLPAGLYLLSLQQVSNANKTINKRFVKVSTN